MYNADDYPTFEENENKFDWNLSYSEMERKYLKEVKDKPRELIKDNDGKVLCPFNHCEEYMKWVAKLPSDVNDPNYITPMTGTQSDFAEFLFKHKDELKKIGVVDHIFSNVRTFIKKELSTAE